MMLLIRPIAWARCSAVLVGDQADDRRQQSAAAHGLHGAEHDQHRTTFGASAAQ